ncbi:MAG: uridine kinase [Bacteroidota bacterium]
MKLVGLCGMSGSGKTHLIRSVKNQLKENVSVLSFDNYYKPIHQQKKDSNGFENFDLPEGIDIQKFLMDLELLKSGSPVFLKVYQFNKPDAKDEVIKIESAPVIILEGIFVFYFQSIFTQLDYRIFIDATLEKTLERRLQRDKEERGLNDEMVMYQWEQHALPGYNRYIYPYRHQADLLLDNENNNEAAAGTLISALNHLILQK